MDHCLDIYGNDINYLVLKEDGTVDGFKSNEILSYGISLSGNPISQDCCTGNSYTWNSENCGCYWKPTCQSDTVKIILNPKNNDAVFFQVDSNEICNLEIGFDYLLDLDTNKLISESNYLDFLDGLTLSVTIEKVIFRPITDSVIYENPTTYETILTRTYKTISTLSNYINGNTETGLRFSGDYIPQVTNNIKSQLSGDSVLVSASTFNSCWLNYNTIITDQSILSGISNSYIKIGFELSNLNTDLSLLIDKIILNRLFTEDIKTDITISNNPGFKLFRTIDNKKSWEKVNTLTNRDSDLKNRVSNYDISDSRLIINTKELDLEIDSSIAIEDSVLNYVKANEICVLPVSPNYESLLYTPLTSITSSDQFSQVVYSELIDVKNRQTIQSYPTLRALYDLYLDPTVNGCPASSAFNYSDLGRFSKSIGTYWIDIIEQFIPATTIWGSTFVYRNSIFDTNKFQYKGYTLFIGNDNPPLPVIASESNVDITKTVIGETDESNYSGVFIVNMSSSSEFIGKVTIISNTSENIITDDFIMLSEG